MTIRIGSDLVYIPKFQRALRENQEYFVQRVFCPEELGDAASERLAGVFASKEAVVKALGLKPGQWRDICVAHEESGRPYLATCPQSKKWHHELTITHENEYALAFVVFYQ